MAEHDAERAGSEEGREPLPAEGTAVPEDGTGTGAGTGPQDAAAARTAPQGGDGGDEGDGSDRSIDEKAAWEAIVAGYGEEPADPPGARPFRSIEDLALLEDDQSGVLDPDKGVGKKSPKPPEKPLGSSIVFAPGVAGPRDYEVAEPKDDDLDDSDEGHFVPPEPPPLPEADVTAKFAWLAVVGGPVLMLIAVLLRWDMTWWLTTICVGGFLGGFVTLVARMQDDDEDGDDPGRGAVV
ncbi:MULTISPECIES: hypothetical protein [unclassified Streptomyces]|uniref:hypothetical protein n=1 Tax=unclassified Streptomyces TaxID=2593676 RepID=UPI0022567276|nr:MULTISPECIES: hypothetical protein [unclassified Streptomyces]WSP54624.1 hypothetical protein OG306_09710 [Streptomyces sp. NBC_01241]WSU24699.1 hypothetical protein OG508_29630 [Streptomyces sp. NBC_01108]MCX4786178.1 hypothetical protein [Streptomyces sp. NBC_01221]MCX4797965.1 hypothetical protein [Streptomyces sp. NBC_01242]WSJ39233.1 hypothetical protein OG772_26645 [Streptomyces sp. NBC_01321]